MTTVDQDCFEIYQVKFPKTFFFKELQREIIHPSPLKYFFCLIVLLINKQIWAKKVTKQYQ